MFQRLTTQFSGANLLLLFLGSVSSPSKKRVLKVPLTTKSRWRSGNVSFYALLFMWWFLTQGIKLLHDLENNGLLMIGVSVIPKPHVHDMSYSHKIRLDGRWMNYETTIATKTSKKTHPIRGDIYIYIVIPATILQNDSAGVFFSTKKSNMFTFWTKNPS